MDAASRYSPWNCCFLICCGACPCLCCHCCFDQTESGFEWVRNRPGPFFEAFASRDLMGKIATPQYYYEHGRVAHRFTWTSFGLRCQALHRIEKNNQEHKHTYILTKKHRIVIMYIYIFPICPSDRSCKPCKPVSL